jgi:MYXO-CTERM domain-containing protein
MATFSAGEVSMDMRKTRPFSVLSLISLALTSAGCGAPAPDEPPGTLRGQLRVTVYDPLDGPSQQKLYLELDGGDWLPLESNAEALADVPSGTEVRLYGARTEDAFVVVDVERLGLGDGLAQTRQALATGSSRVIAAIMINVSGSNHSYTPAQAREAIFGDGTSAKTFWEEGSYGRFTVVGNDDPAGDVFGPYDTNASCTFNGIRDAARNAAQSDGHNLDPYDHIVVLTPPLGSGCPGGGQGDQPGSNALIYGVGINSVWDYVGHEVGHNFGLFHASTWDNCGGAVCGQGHNEYGDPTDIMGRRNGQYMSFYKDIVGWLEPSNVAELTASRQVRICPLETATAGLQSVLVSRGGNDYFHLEYRQAIGHDSYLWTGMTNGILLRAVQSNGTRPMGTPHLINFGSNNNAEDAALEPGQSFTDADIQIAVLEANSDWALVNVIVDGVTPDPVTDAGAECPEAGDTGAGGTGAGGSGAGGTAGSGGLNAGGTAGNGAAAGLGGSAGTSAVGAGGSAGGAAGGSGFGGAAGMSGAAAGVGGSGAATGGALGAGGAAVGVGGAPGGPPPAAGGEPAGCACRAPGKPPGDNGFVAVFGLALAAALGSVRRKRSRATS